MKGDRISLHTKALFFYEKSDPSGRWEHLCQQKRKTAYRKVEQPNPVGTHLI